MGPTIRVNTLLYLQDRGDAAARLREAVARVADGHRLTVVSTRESFVRSLRNPGPDRQLAVLHPGSRAELEELVRLGDLLEDVPVFIVLPDRSTETLRMAHRLRPRYLISEGEDVARLAAVLRRKIDVITAEKERPS